MKSYILSAVVGAGGIIDGKFVKKDGSGGVIASTGPTLNIGIANATKSATDNVGVIKKGIVRVPKTTNAAIKFGDKLTTDTDGQTVITGSSNVIGTAAETKTTTTADNSLYVLIDFI